MQIRLFIVVCGDLLVTFSTKILMLIVFVADKHHSDYAGWQLYI